MVGAVFMDIVQALSLFLAFFVAFFAFRAYRIVRRPHLVNFAFGFVILGVSFFIIFLELEPFRSTPLEGILEWLNEVTRTIAFLLIASAYLTRTRGPQKLLLVALLLSLILAVLVFIVPPFFAIPDPEIVDQYFFAIDTLLVLYIFSRSVESYIHEQRLQNVIVPVGFGLLALSQYTWLLWGLDGGASSFVIANLLRLTSLFFLSLAAASYIGGGRDGSP